MKGKFNPAEEKIILRWAQERVKITEDSYYKAKGDPILSAVYVERLVDINSIIDKIEDKPNE